MAGLVCPAHLRMATGIHLLSISAVHSYFSSLLTCSHIDMQVENAQVDAGLSYRFVCVVIFPIYKFHVG